MDIRFATYNIHRCIGTDGEQRHDRIVKVLDEMDADVVALQEVESFDGDELDFARTLEQTSPYLVVSGPTMFKSNTHYGNLLLSRFPILSLHRIDLSFPRREPRGALVALLQAGEHAVMVVATHLGLLQVERRFQVQKLIHFLKATRELEIAPFCVLMGDINEWHLWGRPIRWIRAFFGRVPARPSFPSGRPVLALDRIWIHPRTALMEIHAHRSETSRVASDHLPVKASITLSQPVVL